MGACVSAEGICGDRAEVWAAVGFRVWSREGNVILYNSRGLLWLQSLDRLLIDAGNDRPRPSL